MKVNMLVEVLEPSILRMPELSDDAFFDFCANNEEYRIERTAEGRVVIMSGTGARTGARNMRLSAKLLEWSDRDGSGAAFDSSTLFRLPNSRCVPQTRPGFLLRGSLICPKGTRTSFCLCAPISLWNSHPPAIAFGTSN
jgi:Uma2 family endonuclease